MSNHATALYYQRTIHLAEPADGPIQDAYCGKRLIGAIDTEAAATCPACLRHAAELEESDAYDAQRDAETAEREQRERSPLHLHRTLTEADRPTPADEPRELIGCEARDLRPGDIIVAAGCQHRDFRGCDHRLFAAFDLLLQDGEAGERMTIWTAIADQEAGQPPRLTLPAGQQLLVQRRLPDWHIAEAPSFAASIIDLAMPELPLLCGPAGNLARGGDLNSDWTCRRARVLWGAHCRAAELQEECARLGRMRSERRRGLADWIARAFVRYEQLNRRLLRELPPCGHPEELRAELSVEEALPACTC